MGHTKENHIIPIVTALVIITALFSYPAAAGTAPVSHASVAINAVIPATAPLAAFSAEPRTGSSPLTVTFTDQSSGTITAWQWDFGDGKKTQQQNVTHVYSRTGTFTVKLTVTGPQGSNTTVKQGYITVTEPAKKPIARFTQSTHAGQIPLTIWFTDRSRNDPTSCQWDFGDGSGSTEFNPSHTYTGPGYYPVHYTATNAAGSDTAKGFVIAIALPHRGWWR